MDRDNNLIYIGVTGHRSISTGRILEESIHTVFLDLIQENPLFDINLVNPLAEGSDQLIASIAQEFPSIRMIVPLPFPEKRYLQDFMKPEGKSTFYKFLESAKDAFVLPDQTETGNAYRRLGEFLVDRCDRLIAIWDGYFSDKPGGTGEVVKLWIATGKPMIWIYAPNGNDQRVIKNAFPKKIGDIEIIGPNYPGAFLSKK